MPAGAPAGTRSFTVAVPFERVVRSLRDPDALVTALYRAAAEADLEEIIGTFGRWVTVMFGDVEGFTPLTERLGDEAAARLVRGLDSVVQRALAANGGHRLKSTGDGFMALFTEPAAALRAAGRIQQSVTEPAGEGASPRMRMGLHTGPVVGIRGANGGRDVVGRTVIVASRISDVARGGEVLVSEPVRRLTEPLGEFRFRQEHRVALKGLAGLHPVTELAWRAFERRIP